MTDSVSKTVKTNDLKRGARVVFRDGRTGTIMDNKRGNIRCVMVEGPFREQGDCYMHDLYMAYVGGERVLVELTPAQVKLSRTVANIGGW